MVDEIEEAILLDAARYRWLRRQYWNESKLAVVLNPREAVRLGYDLPSLDRLDDMIDENMKGDSDATKTR